MTAPALDIAALNFTARTDPWGPAIRLAWTLPDPKSDPADLRIRVLRRERRFPGLARRGWAPVPASPADLTDGRLVYDSASPVVDFEETRGQRLGGRRVDTTRQYLYRGTPRDRSLVGLVRRVLAADSTPLSTVVEIVDRTGLEAGTVYYYTTFVGDLAVYSRATQASAPATGRYPAGLFATLPQADRVRDTGEPAPFTVAREDEGKGQLQRYVETVEVHADMLRGLVEGLGLLHDPRRADARLLPHLAHHIGWRLKDYLDEDAQRAELMFAPEFYRTVGTTASITAMINRLTGWDTRIKEYARNIVVSYDTGRRERLDGGAVAYADGTMTALENPPYLAYRTRPPGSVDTTDAQALYQMRNRVFDDTTVYTYDCGKLVDGSYVRDDDTWYSRETVGVYIVPDVDTEVFVPQDEWARIRSIVQEFLPINTRAVFVLMPGVVVEEEYNATKAVDEQVADNGQLVQDELYGEGTDAVADAVPGWKHFITNDLVHRSVDVTAVPIDTGSRTWHTALS